MVRKTKNPPSETDILLTNYIDQTLANTGKIGWSSEEVTGMVQEVMKRFLERCLESEMDFHLKNGEIASALKFVYQGGGNLTECLVFGQVCGKEVAKLPNRA